MICEIHRARAFVRRAIIYDALLRLGLIFLLFLSAADALAMLPLARKGVVFWFLVFLTGCAVLFLIKIYSKRWEKSGGAIPILENRFPQLRSDLSTYVEWKTAPKDHRFSYSLDLLCALENSLPARLASLPFSQFFGLKSVLLRQKQAVAAAAILIAWFVFVRSPINGILSIRASSHVSNEPIGWLENAPSVFISDITSSLEYPPYTRIPNKTGIKLLGNSLTVPKGTKISFSFQTDLAMKEVGLLFKDGEYAVATHVGANIYEIHFPALQSGVFGFQGKDRENVVRQDPILRNLEVIEDEVPKVSILKPEKEMEVQRDSRIEVTYSVKDDYELSRVAFHLRFGDIEQTVPIEIQPSRSIEGETHLSLSSLPIRKGISSIVMEIHGTDNDAVSGPKVGRSDPVILRFKNEAEAREARIAKATEWQDRFLDLLADTLEGLSDRPQRYSTAFADLWRKSLQESEDLLAEIDAEVLRKTEMTITATKLQPLLAAVVNLRKESIPLLKSDSASWGLFQSKHFSGLQDTTTNLESAVLYLDRAHTLDRLDQLAELSSSIESFSDALLDRLENASNSMDKKGIESALQEIRNMTNEMTGLMASLYEKGFPEFANPEAFQKSDLGQMQNIFKEIDRLLKEGKFEEAKQKLKEYAKKLKQMAQQLRQNRDQVKQNSVAKLAEALSETRETVQSLKADQRSLKDETVALRKRSDSLRTKKLIRKYRERQAEIRKRVPEVTKKLKDLQNMLPLLDPTIGEIAEQSSNEMENSAERLSSEDPEASIPHQQEAISKLERLERQLEETAQEISQEAGIAVQVPGQPQPFVGQQRQYDPVAIPEQQRRKEVEEWRRELMDAMKEKPPAGFEDVTRKYFEELAR